MSDDCPSSFWRSPGREIPATLLGVGVPVLFYGYHHVRFHANGAPGAEAAHYAALAVSVFLGLVWSRIFLIRDRWMSRPGLVAFLAAFLLPVTVKLTGDLLVLNRLFDTTFWFLLAVAPVAGALASESAVKLASRIRTAESRLRRMAAAASDGLWESDFSTQRVFWSESFRRNFFYDAHPPGDTFEWLRERIHPDDREDAALSFDRAVAMPTAADWSGTFRFLRGDGIFVWVLSKARFERAADGAPRFAFGGITDITERKSRERLLESLTRELEERVRELSAAEARTLRLARAGADGLWTLDCENGSLTWDAAFGKAFRYDPGAIETTLAWWSDRIHPDDRDCVSASFSSAEQTATVDTWQHMYRFRRGDSSYAWVMDRGVFERDESGRAVRAFGGMMDISERINLEEELRRRVEQRTRDLAALTRSVTHDLKSPLSSILGYGDLLEASGAVTDPGARERLRLMVRGAERMLLMVNDILEQAKGGEPAVRMDSVDLGLLVRDLRDEFEPRLQRLGGRLILPEGPLPEVISAYAPLYRMLQNLVGNACKYRRDEVVLEIRVGFEIRMNWLLMRVSDNGLGIRPESLPTLFDFGVRFDTEKAEGHGIGLYNVRTIARRLGGDVSVESTPGEGSIFTVKVPGRIDMP